MKFYTSRIFVIIIFILVVFITIGALSIYNKSIFLFVLFTMVDIIYILFSIAILFKKAQSVVITEQYFKFYPSPYKQPTVWEWDEIKYVGKSSRRILPTYIIMNEKNESIRLVGIRNMKMIREIINKSNNINLNDIVIRELNKKGLSSIIQ